MLTSIDRTAYPGFSRAPQLKELIELYSPTPADMGLCQHNRPWSQSEN